MNWRIKKTSKLLIFLLTILLISITMSGCLKKKDPNKDKALEISSTTPTKDATNIGAATQIKVVFGKDINVSTVTASRFTVAGAGENVTGTISFEGNKTAVFTPVYLDYNADYTVTLSSDIADTYGKKLSGGYSFRFTTGSYSGSTSSYGQTDLADAGGSLTATLKDPVEGNDNYDIGRFITIKFNKAPKASTVHNGTFRILDYNTGTELEGEIKFNDDFTEAIFEPLIQYYNAEEVLAHRKGIQLDTKYRVVLNGVKDLTDASLPKQEFTFTTTDNDYGLYWFGEDGYCQKFLPEQTNKYYDPNKKIALFSHGWQAGSTSLDYWTQNPWYVVASHIGPVDFGKMWKDNGDYNLGNWLWGQFADEGLQTDLASLITFTGNEVAGVADAESKIWRGNNGGHGMRYRLKDNSYRNFDTAKINRHRTLYNVPVGRKYKAFGSESETSTIPSVHELFFDVYKEALADYTGGYIRILGHSLGNQVVTALTHEVLNELSSIYHPEHMVLLDPYWSKYEKAYLGNKWPGEHAREKVESMIENQDLIVSMYRSSRIAGFDIVPGDKNLPLRELVAFYRIWPSFAAEYEVAFHHSWAIHWYTYSINPNVYIEEGTDDNENTYHIGASATDTQIRNMMNYHNADKVAWVHDEGYYTADISDDKFKKDDTVDVRTKELEIEQEDNFN